MQRFRKSSAFAELPAPIVLTPDQLSIVAAGTAVTPAKLGAVTRRIIVAGGYPTGPLEGPVFQSTTM